MAEEYHLTQEALDELKAELENKVNVKRPKLAKRLKAAIELGDLSDAEYHSAKEAQGFLEGAHPASEEDHVRCGDHQQTLHVMGPYDWVPR